MIVGDSRLQTVITDLREKYEVCPVGCTHLISVCTKHNRHWWTCDFFRRLVCERMNIPRTKHFPMNRVGKFW